MRRLGGWLGALVAALVALLLLVGSIGLCVLRETDADTTARASATAFASYALIGFVVAALILAVLLRFAVRTRGLVVAALVLSLAGVALQVVWNAPLFVRSGGGSPDLTVLTANLQFGNADPATVVRLARSNDAQVVVLEEVTFDSYARLQDAGLGASYPHVAGRPGYSANGTVVLSRRPLSAVRPLQVSNGGVQVRVGGKRPFTLIAVHPSQPARDARQWHADLTVIRSVAARAVRRGPTVVAGDFNATRDHPVFRRILGVGLADAAERAGSGWQPTWPESEPIGGANGVVRRTWLRPVIAIDHVLVSRQLTAVRTTTSVLPGSDHRALVAGLRFTSR